MQLIIHLNKVNENLQKKIIYLMIIIISGILFWQEIVYSYSKNFCIQRTDKSVYFLFQFHPYYRNFYFYETGCNAWKRLKKNQVNRKSTIKKNPPQIWH